MKSRPAPIRPADALDIARQFLLAEASENPRKAIEELSAGWKAKYGLSEARLRRIVARHKGRLAAQPNRPDAKSSARNKEELKGQGVGGVGATKSSLLKEVAAIGRPRERVPNLPRLTAAIDLEAVADIFAGKSERQADREAILTCLRQFAPNRSGEYSYLTWRYDAIRPSHSEPRLTTVHQDLIALAVVIDQERQLLDSLVRDHGSILTNPDLAEHGLDREFRRIVGTTQGTHSLDDKLRSTRAAIDFLRRAVILTIASAGNGQSLWDLLGRLQPLTSPILSPVEYMLRWNEWNTRCGTLKRAGRHQPRRTSPAEGGLPPRDWRPTALGTGSPRRAPGARCRSEPEYPVVPGQRKRREESVRQKLREPADVGRRQRQQRGRTLLGTETHASMTARASEM